MSESAGVSPETTNLRKLFVEKGEVLRPRDIAEVLGYREDTVTTWLKEGTLRGFQMGRSWRIVKEDFFADMEARSSIEHTRTHDPLSEHQDG